MESFPGARAVLVVDPADAEMAKDVLARETPRINVEFVNGGRTRHDSEFNALKHLSSDISAGNIDVVLIHDGARPLASSHLFKEIASAAQRHGGALPAIDVNSLEIDLVTDKQIARVQTPQAFRAKEVLAAYMQADREGFTGTDTAACMEQYFPNTESVAVPGEVTNIKITYPHDLVLAQLVLTKLGNARN